MKRKAEFLLTSSEKNIKSDPWSIRHCEGLTVLRDMLTIRTACMYEFLRKNVDVPEKEIGGYMLTAPVLLSFMFSDYNSATPLLKKSFSRYYYPKTSQYDRNFRLVSALLEINFKWNRLMTQEGYHILYKGLNIRYLPGTNYYNMFAVAMKFNRSENWKLRSPTFTEDGSADKTRSLEYYVDWGDGFVKKVTDPSQRIRTTTPGISTSYFSVIIGSINIFKILSKYKMTGLLDQHAGIYERYYVDQRYDYNTFEQGRLIPTREIFVTFPWFEISFENFYNTRNITPLNIQHDGETYVVWRQLYISVLSWYNNSFLTVTGITKETKIFLTGHSLGGAQSCVAALILRMNGYKNCSFYGFGSPRIGGPRLATLIDSMFANTDSMNLMNMRYIYSGDKFWVEYDPVTKYPPLPEFSTNGRVYAIESGFIYKPIFGTYANQPQYHFGKMFGESHSLLPIDDRCGKHWLNLHTGKSVDLEALYGNQYNVKWTADTSLPINTVIDLNIYACSGILPFNAPVVGKIPGITGKVVKRSVPEQCGVMERVGGWIRHCTYNFPGVKRLWESHREPVRTDYDRLMLQQENDYLKSARVNKVPIPKLKSNIEIVTIPADDTYYKSMTVNDLRNLETRKLTWYGTLVTAMRYKKYFGPVFAFKTTKPLKLLLLNNPANIEFLIRLFDKYEKTDKVSKNVWFQGENHIINVKPSYLLRMVIGYGVTCRDMEQFRNYFMSKTGFSANELPFVPSACDDITSGISSRKQSKCAKGVGYTELQRFSIYEVDKTVFQNMCNVLKEEEIPIDGYMMRTMPSSFGVFIDKEECLFPFEIMLCDANGMVHNPLDRNDYASRARNMVSMGSKSRRFTILSMNVHYYQDASMKKIASAIMTSRPPPDIICLQEDVVNVEPGNKTIADYLAPHYVLARRCIGQSMDDAWVQKGYKIDDETTEKSAYANLGNTIYVKNTINVDFSWDFELEANIMIAPPRGSRYYIPRCVSIITIGGITIANVHLTGGGHEDKYFNSNINVKTNQLREIVLKFQPDIICGDFNGEYTPQNALKQLLINPAYKNAMKRGATPEITNNFLTYTNGWSEMFRNPTGEVFDYKPVYLESDVKETSIYGGTPDWVLYKPQYVHPVDYQQLIGYTRGKSGEPGKPVLSDHDGILVTFTDLPEGNKRKRYNPNLVKAMMSGPMTRSRRAALEKSLKKLEIRD